MKRLVILVALILLTCSACSDGSSEPSTGSESHWLTCNTDNDCPSGKECVNRRCTADASSGDEQCLLPYNVDPDCEPAPAPSPCDWAVRADAVVFGEVTAVQLVEQPATVAVGSHTGLVNSCTGAVNFAVDIKLRIEQTLWGTIDAESLSIRIAHRKLDQWQVYPRRATDGSIDWLGSTSYLSCVPMVGQKLGMPLYHLDQMNVWTPMGSVFFTVTSDENNQQSLLFEPNHDTRCDGGAPTGFSHERLDHFAAQLANCQDTSSAQQTREQREAACLQEDGCYLPVCVAQNDDDYACAQTSDCLHSDEECVQESCRTDCDMNGSCLQ